MRTCIAGIVLILFSFVLSCSIFPQGTTATPFQDDLSVERTQYWTRSDGRTNGPPFLNGWRADHVNFRNGHMLLTLSEEGCNLPGGCSGQWYASGEYQSDQTYQYGTYTARMRAAKGCGLVTGFFVFHAKWDQKGNVLEWDEIDVEILGKNTKQIYTNWITDVAGVDVNQQPIRVRKNHEAPPVTLPFDAAEGFYDYIFQWQPDSIKWYVRHTDPTTGQVVTTPIREVLQSQETDTLPKRSGKIIMNFWAACNSWAGCEGPIDPSTGKPDPNPVCFSGEGPVSVAFDHVSYSP